MNKLVEISSIEYPPQLVDHQAEHMLESFRTNIERQGMQYQQYLKLLGKEQSAFEQEIRTEAEVRVRRSLALDAFATAEQIDSGDGGDGSASEQQAEARSARALERLVDLATGDGRNGSQAETSEMTAEQAETPDTGSQTRDADAPATPEAQEEQEPHEP
jgi:hypothetical protein